MTGADVEVLAGQLGEVFFGAGGTEASTLDAVDAADAAVAAGLEVVESALDELGPEVAAGVVDLVIRLRDRRLDRVTCRALAGAALAHVADRVGVDGSAFPLAVLLGALCTVPDGPELYERALDPAPDPSRPVEAALAELIARPEPRTARLDALLAGPFYLPVLDLSVQEGSLALRFLPVVVRGQPAISAFTSPERVAEHARAAGVGEVPLIEVDGGELATICPLGHGVAVNPGAVLGCSLGVDEVTALAAAR